MNLSVALPILVTGAGIYFLFELKGLFFAHPLRAFRALAGTLKEKDSFRAFSLALAGTLGVGNVFGVAAGIIIGGAGSVLWLFVSSIFAMIIKYAETVLAADTATVEGGGMHLVLLSSFPRIGGLLSKLYAALCLVLGLFMGFTMQSASVVTVANVTTGISPIAVAVLLAALLIPSVIGGGERIEKFTAFAIPLTTVVYILMSILVIAFNFERLPAVISEIFSSAMSPLSAGGGLLAFLSSRSLHEGYSRGILSNEAGTGTSAMAHTRATERPPAVAGLCGACEVFFDTLLLCTLTALAVLTAIPNEESYISPMTLVTDAFVGTLGNFSGVMLLVCIFLFAYSTIVCWFYYGGKCSDYLFGPRSRLPFFILFLVFTIAGAFGESRVILSVTDFAIFCMTVLTVLVLVRSSDRIRELSLSVSLITEEKYKKSQKP